MKILATLLVTIAFALPAAAQYDETAKSFHLLPHLADGGGWQSILLVTNVSQSASRCTFNVYGMPLNRFSETSGITAAGSTATFQLEGDGGYLVWATKNELALASGYATLDCSAAVVAQIVFASVDGASGVATAAATVFSAQAATVFQFPVLTAAASLGFAIANDTNAEASCRIVLEDSQRTNLGEAMLSVPAKSNKSQLLNTAISIPETFRGGTAVVSCNQQVAMIGCISCCARTQVSSPSPRCPRRFCPLLRLMVNRIMPRSNRLGLGTWIVNEDIAPGRYFTNPLSGCYWERLSGTTGSSSDILANEFIGFDSGQEIVDIASSDYAFKPDHECGMWSQTPLTAPSSGILPGRWLVGRQIPAGQYETNASRGCILGAAAWLQRRAQHHCERFRFGWAGGRSSRFYRQMKGFTAMMTVGCGVGERVYVGDLHRSNRSSHH